MKRKKETQITQAIGGAGWLIIIAIALLIAAGH